MESLRNADAADHGLTRGALRRPDYVSPTHGVSMLASRAHLLVARCRAVQLALPADAVFTHVTAAQLRGWWLPDVPDLPLIACSDGDAPHHERRGVYVRRCTIPPEHRLVVDGVRIASPEWTIIELSEHLALLDLVATIDCALHWGHTSVDAIRASMRKGRRGVRVLRRALDLCDGRSESRWETFLRLVHTLSGVRVEPQKRIRVGGEIVARADLGIVGTDRIAEYDGADHRDAQQHRSDLRRDKVLARAGIERFGYTAVELLGDPGRIIADADAALRRNHDPRRVDPWLREVELSSLTVVGRHALGRRLQRFVRLTPPRAA